MATLHVRNVPDTLYEQLRLQAEREGRSLSAEVITLLEHSLRQTGRDQSVILADIRRRRYYDPARHDAPDSVTMIRAMREGRSVVETGDDATAPTAPEHTMRDGVTAYEVTLDDQLVAEARRVGQHPTDVAAVTTALEEYITRQRQRAIFQLFGAVEYDPEYDYKAQRQRS